MNTKKYTYIPYKFFQVPLVVFANKQDISGAVNGKELEEILHLHDRHPDQLWYIQVK